MAADDSAIRLYFTRRLAEARIIRAEALQVEAEIIDVLAGGAPEALDPVRLDAWIEKRRTHLAHIDVELDVFAGARLGSPWWVRWVVWACRRVAGRGSRTIYRGPTRRDN